MYSALLRKAFLHYILRRENRESSLKYRRLFEDSQFWPRQRLLDYQWGKLKDLLDYSYKNCRYYKKIFDERGLTPDSVKSFEDLSLLPILTRDIIFDHGEQIISSMITSPELEEFSTGGTTGQQAKMYRDQQSFNIKLAMEWRHEGWMGRKPCEKMAYFWPAHIDIVEDESFKARIKNRYILRQLVLNAGTFSEDALRGFYDDIVRFKPKYLKVFPASLYYFTEFIEYNDLPTPNILGIMSSGETLYDFQKEKLERVFGCPVFDMYGSREVGNTASECSAHEGMHIAMETSLVEFVTDGKQVDYGQEGHIIITDLTNYAMPLIRYQIDDYGIPLRQSCSCGRELHLMSTVVGRLLDDFWGLDGTRHSGNVLGFHLTVAEEGIEIGQVQFIQESLTKFHVRITDKPEPTPKVFEYLARRMKDIIGNGIDITFEVVKEIPREKSGKIRYAICEIDPPPNARFISQDHR